MKIDFEFTTLYGIFRDALYLDNDNQLTEVEINELKQDRLENWLAAIENPSIPELEIIELDGMQYKKIEINGQIMLKPVTN